MVYLDEGVFMKQPIGYRKDSFKVCRLNKLSNGLNQASRSQNRRFQKFIIGQGFNQSKSDNCLWFIHKMFKLINTIYYLITLF